MYLEKLEIQGFKSFANKNKLIFSGLVNDQKKGLTAIVGPNGSGKSNIADAVRWALGEQSIKTLRGRKSEDVIFSGSDKKNQLSLAEVSLFLNNQERVNKQKKLNNKEKYTSSEKETNNLNKTINYCSQIIITRRVFRSGESEYLLNGNRVRLADIQMLLAKANFGQKTYSVIGQGMVDNFLNSSATERKDFFDEATGVKQFQIKRDSALNKLESSYENLQQVEMLISEIKPRLRSLTRQMEKLKKREEIEKALKQAQLKYYGFNWQKISKKLNEVNNEYLDLEKIKREKEKKLDILNEDLNHIRQLDNFQRINELQPLLRDLQEEKANYQKKLAKLEIEQENQLESQGKFDLSWLSNKINELKSEVKNLDLEIKTLEKSQPLQEEKGLLSQIQEIDQEILSAKKIKEEINNLEQKYNLKKIKLTELEVILKAQNEAKLNIDSKKLKNQAQEISAILKNLDIEIDQLKRQEKENQDKKQDLNKKNSLIQEGIKKINQELQKINEKIKKSTQAEGKEAKISRLINDFLTELEKIDSISDLKKVKLLIKDAKDKFQQEIKILLTGKSDEDAKIIQKLQQKIIELTEKRQEINEQLNKLNSKQVKIKEEINLKQEKNNRLNWELQNIENELTKQSPEKEEKISQEINIIKEEIKNIKEKKVELINKERLNFWQDKKEKILESLQSCRIKKSAINEKIELLKEKERKTENEINDLEIKIKKSQNKFDNLGLEKEKDEIEKKINNLEEGELKIENELTKLHQEKEKEKESMFFCQKKIQALQQELNTFLNRLNNLKIESTRQETKLEDLENNIRVNNLELQEISNFELKENEIDSIKLEKTINSSKNQLEQIGGIDKETETEYQETKKRYDFLSAQTTDLDQAIKSLEQIIKELDVNIKDKFDKEFKIISEKFNKYFQILFSGGNAKISKIMIEDLEKEENEKRQKNLNNYLDAGLSKSEAEIKIVAIEKLQKIKFLKKHNAIGLAGIEIQATPPGKKIQSISMLSGGERALTAIALICAIINANPSPFVILDEVDAALDESNSERLAKILDDLSNKTQFIIITHNRASMRRASILYGVTMQNDGVSQIISVKLDNIKLPNKK